MYRLSCYALTGLGVLHLLVLGLDAAAEAPGWFAGGLWTWDHWKPLVSQDRDLVLSGFAFWLTIGSFALPLIVLGGLLVQLDRQGVVVPKFVGLGIASWLVTASLLMPPSGFPIGVLVALGLVFGRQGGRIARDSRYAGDDLAARDGPVDTE